MVMQTIEQQAPATMPGVERRPGLSQSVFVHEFVKPRRPVVLLDATAGWGALRWTPEMLQSRFGDRKVIVAYGTGWRKMPLNSFVAAAQQLPPITRRTGASRFSLYLRNRHIGVDFPELLHDFEIPLYFTPNWLAEGSLSSEMPFSRKEFTEFFFGHPGAIGPVIHQDAYRTHAWISQIYGRKKVWMAAPHSTCLYPNPENPMHSLLNDFEFADRDRFPEYDPKVVLHTVLVPGETIFIPSGWWHTAECETSAISLSGNFANGSNWARFSASFRLPSHRKPGRGHSFKNRILLGWHGLTCAVRDGLRSRSDGAAPQPFNDVRV